MLKTKAGASATKRMREGKMKDNIPFSFRSFFLGSLLFMAYVSTEVIVFLSAGKLQNRIAAGLISH